MTELFWSVLIGLTSYRLWRIYAMDNIAEPVRAWVMRHDRLDRINELLHCPWCIGFWYCLVLTIAPALEYDWSLFWYIIVALAASAWTGFISRLES